MSLNAPFIIWVVLVFFFNVVIAVELATTATTTNDYAHYGEPCTSEKNCDHSAYLTCINGQNVSGSSCQCALINSMKFDDLTSSCFVLPGEKCIYKGSEIGIAMEVFIDSTESVIRDRISFRCVSGASCIDGICTCDGYGYATANGTCESQREVGESCDNNEMCRSSLHLICNSDGKCGCNETNSEFDVNHGLCVGLPGSSCFDFELCTENAYCPSFGIFNQFDVACTCKNGYFEKNRTCVQKLGNGAACTNNQECRDDLNLVCDPTKKVCACNETTHMFDIIDGCLALVGSSCTEGQNCVADAQCVHSGFLNGNILSKHFVCRCLDYAFEGRNKTCMKKTEYAGDCVDDSHCREDLKLLCNKITNRCTCNESSHTFDRSRKRCLSLAGTSCERNEQCVINSFCKSPGYLYPRHSPKAQCICKDGFEKSADGFCLGKYGSRCESWTTSCKSDLTCRNGECICRAQQYYDYTRETCVTYLNAQCTNESTTCVANAACVKQDNVSSDLFCACNPGTVPMDGNKKCVSLVGEKCSEGEGSYLPCVPFAKCYEGKCLCNSVDYFTSNGTCERKRGHGEKCKNGESRSCEDNFCDKNGHCGCNSTTSIFDPAKESCVRLANQKCNDLRACVPNAVCRRLNPVLEDACICKEGYFENTNGTCEFKRHYGSPCKESKQCQDAADLICSVHGRCECNVTISMFDETRRSCLRLHGSHCSSRPVDCVRNSKCRNPNAYWVHLDSFSPHAKCECEKDLGYTNSSDGRCIIDYYGGSCDNSVPCSETYICSESHCVCPYEDHQIYDYKTRNCISLVKGPCDNSTNLCVKNAQCQKTEDGVFECLCKQGFSEVDRRCELTFGQFCFHKNSRNVSNEEVDVCDRMAPLKCVHGTCQCGGFQFYDYELKKCRGLVGARCFPDDPKMNDFCTEGATCEAYRGLATKRYGRCNCMKNYFADDNRSCSLIL